MFQPAAEARIEVLADVDNQAYAGLVARDIQCTK